jgi:Flp pilus assembly pilin Flp
VFAAILLECPSTEGKGVILIKLKQVLEKVFRYFCVPPEEGQGLVEYALLLFLIGLVVITVMNTIGPAIYDVMNKTVDYGLS